MNTGQLVRQVGTAVRIPVRVQPRASRSAVEGQHGGAWRVRVQAPPVEGAANEAVCELLARVLGVPRRQVRVVAGASARSKVVEVADSVAEEVLTRLSGAATSDRRV